MSVSAIAYQVMWNRLISVVEEQAQALVRTAFSTSVREAGDLSAGVYDEAGRMLAQAVTGTPGHVNAMADSVGHFIAEIGRQNMAEGDVYITNDPWRGTGHLHDITVVSPSFHQGRLAAYFACTAHVVDIGGRGFGADGNSVYEEGLFIPIAKLHRGGEPNDELLEIIAANVRAPEEVLSTFVVDPGLPISASRSPALNVTFPGARKDVSVWQIIASNGPRVPSVEESQKEFKYAFILVTSKGATAPEDEVSKLDTLRQDFERFFPEATSYRATADTTLVRPTTQAE